jgi:hypothetical protein
MKLRKGSRLSAFPTGSVPHCTLKASPHSKHCTQTFILFLYHRQTFGRPSHITSGKHQTNAYLFFSIPLVFSLPWLPKSEHRPTPSKVRPSVETDGEPAPLLPDNPEMGRLQRYKSWTPIPREEEEFIAWARKHLGERSLELYEARRREKDHLKEPLKYYDIE